MNLPKVLFFILLLFFAKSFQAQQNRLDFGINLTGLERYWEHKKWDEKETIKDIDELYNKGIRAIRLPVAFEHQFTQQSKRRFLKCLVKVIKHVQKKDMTLIICYFDHTLNKETNFSNLNTIKENWEYISKKLRKYSNCVYYELVNEPNLYPIQWDAMVQTLVPAIRKKDKKTKILIGATNYNSIYELSRKKPFPFNNLIYSFHFYEPFLFTHQGADWIGNQSKTTNIPYPYDSIKMPSMHLDALGTAGEINYKDYKHMANKISLGHKIDIVVQWAKQHQVELWCTEFGTINTIPQKYRNTYFKDMLAVFKEKNIRCYVWEYKGNFGINNTKILLE